ncbi:MULTISPECIES: hypothetical protein [unclassified Clostridium]|uniref:hypothetical protein n=1 Tax=unclassified Clostridium TaxID=2614128 RepID=UPI0025C12568|nr:MULTISPECIES: hypothetical protein [unclassified Clostridium]
MCSENNHKLVYLDAKKYSESTGFNSKWTRIDRFYCEKCGELIIKKKEEYSRESPDWY